MSRFILRGYAKVQKPEEFYKFQVYLKHSKTKIKIYNHKSKRAIPPEARSAQGKKMSGQEQLAAIEGWRLTLVKPYIDDILNEFKPEKEYLQTTFDGKVHDNIDAYDDYMITQDYGIRLAVLFKVIARIQIKEKITNIFEAIQSMEMDELFYWWKKLFEVEDDTKVFIHSISFFYFITYSAYIY
jgi:hypothetical protein